MIGFQQTFSNLVEESLRNNYEIGFRGGGSFAKIRLAYLAFIWGFSLLGR
jgi:hypothetical protein